MPMTFSLYSSYLFYTPTTSLFATFSWKTWVHSAAHNFYSMQPLFIFYTHHFTICNIFLKNMGPFCCPWLLAYAVPIYLHPPHHYWQHFLEKLGSIQLPLTFTVCSPYLFSTPITSLFFFLKKLGPFHCPWLLLYAVPLYFLHYHFTICNIFLKIMGHSAAHDFYSMQPLFIFYAAHENRRRLGLWY